MPDKNDKSIMMQFAGLTADISKNAAKNAAKSAVKSLTTRAGNLSLKVGKTLVLSKEQLTSFTQEEREWMKAAGAAIKDARNVAGLTIDELSEALDLEDKTLLQAIEQGSATLSFDLIVRLTSLLSRHDPIPFVVNMIRGLNPQLWAILEDWGLGQLPTMVERDRMWVNIYRSREDMKDLTDEQFEKVIDFTQSAFEMGMAFVDVEKNDNRD